MSGDFIELLSPAKDVECGIAAINAGADAVYIGGPGFGAREKAGNPVTGIGKLVRYAHIFSAKVYVALNTIIYENELEGAHKLVWRLYDAGVDAFIIQDMAFMMMDMPPVPLHASTQANNYSKEKIVFLGKSGFKRVVLARELTLDHIREIRQATGVELEVFVHGSLCVSMSGQCYMSHAVGGRSANRGACAQPCRKTYSLVDEGGRIITDKKHLLSLKDLSLSGHLEELVDAGVNSFKIEGRMKEAGYVANVTAYYRKRIDELSRDRSHIERSSYGFSRLTFEPDPVKSFNRGFTDYFLHGRKNDICSPDTPKSVGEKIGKVLEVSKNSFELEGGKRIGNNDGLMFIDANGVSRGIKVNMVKGNAIFPESVERLYKGAVIYRNYDHAFQMALEKNGSVRLLDVYIELSLNGNIIKAKATTGSGHSVEMEFDAELIPARNSERSVSDIKACFMKSGDTPFLVTDVDTGTTGNYFFRTSVLNGYRRALLEGLLTYLENYREELLPLPGGEVDYPAKKPGFEANVSNSKAREFYMERGVEEIEDAFELKENTEGLRVMTTKHCLKYFSGFCPKYPPKNKVKDPGQLFLYDGERRFRLEFDCGKCEMRVYH